MDKFDLVQQFFTHMRCSSCEDYLEPDSVKLIRESDDMYVVHIQCTHCEEPMGMALVGLETRKPEEGDEDNQDVVTQYHYDDPELPPAEKARLAQFETISYDDVLDAHTFFDTLDAQWMQHVPEALRQAG